MSTYTHKTFHPFKGIVNLFSCEGYKISYFNIHENIVLYLSQFITRTYQFTKFSQSLFFFHLVFY